MNGPAKNTIPLWKDQKHDHFWISGEVLYETYHTLRGLRYREKKELPGMPDSDNCTPAMLIYIEKQYYE